jgi:hypothetical protein
MPEGPDYRQVGPRISDQGGGVGGYVPSPPEDLARFSTSGRKRRVFSSKVNTLGTGNILKYKLLKPTEKSFPAKITSLTMIKGTVSRDFIIFFCSYN